MRVTVAILGLMAILLIGRGTVQGPRQARAAGSTITVTGTADAISVASLAGNGTCDLAEA